MRYHPIAALAPAFFSPAHIQKCIDRSVLAFPIQAIHCIACMGNAVHSTCIWVHGRLSLTVQNHTIWTFLGFFGITLHFVGFWGISSKALGLIWIMCHYMGGTCIWDALTPRPPTERVSWIKFVSFLWNYHLYSIAVKAEKNCTIHNWCSACKRGGSQKWGQMWRPAKQNVLACCKKSPSLRSPST